MSRLIPIIASRHRHAAVGLTQPVILNSNMWFQNVNAGSQPAARSWTTPADTEILLCLAAGQYVDSFGTPSWNGETMPFLAAHSHSKEHVRAWALEGPHIGSASLTFSAFNWNLNGAFHPCLIALRGASSSGIDVVKGGGLNQASPVTTPATPNAATDLLCDIIGRTDNEALIAGGSQTLLHDGGYRSRGAVSYQLARDLGALPFTWSWTGNGTEDTAHIILKIPGK